MGKIYITRKIPDNGIKKLQDAGHEVVVNPEDRVLEKSELIAELTNGSYDAVLSLLTDTIDEEVLDAAGKQCKVFANYAVGYDNINVPAANERGIIVTNTPGVLTNTVAEHTVALLLSISHRIVEADAFTRAGKYVGWEPELLLGNDLSGKTIGIVGLGRIGARVAYHLRWGFDMSVCYYDIAQNTKFEEKIGARFYSDLADMLPVVDYISIHVPLLESTKHLIGAAEFKLMKESAYLVNTSRGPVINENELVAALKSQEIRGAAIDVFEEEPELAPGLRDLANVIITPHIASGTVETRGKMAEMAAENIIKVLAGEEAPQIVRPKSS